MIINYLYFLLFVLINAYAIVLFMKKNKNVYDIAYELGVNYLDNISLMPNYAVMFDIDDTLIFSTNYKPIKPIIKLLKECNKRNILVLIITARDNIYKDETVDDLKQIKIYSKYDNFYDVPKKSMFYDYIYLRKNPQDNHQLFKSNVKKELAEKGIFTIMSIGDNEVDVIGPYSGYAIKLPNTRDPRLFHKDSHGYMVNVI
jgi:hypothetical protein